MKIGIYNESTSNDSILGGSEVLAAVIAQTLHQSATDRQVDFVHHSSALDKERMARLAGVDLGAVNFRYFARDTPKGTSRRNYWRRYQGARSWHAELSQQYDVFIAIVHGVPPFCHAKHGLLMVLFPFFESPPMQESKRTASYYLKRPHRVLERPYLAREWSQRLETYQQKTSISEFTRRWTRD